MSRRRPGSCKHAALCALWVWALLSCGDDAASDATAPVALLPGLGLGSQLLLVDTLEERAAFRAADVARGEASTTVRRALPPNPRLVVARAEHATHALVLGEGLRGVGEGATLTLLDPDEETPPYALAEAFDAVAQSPDGRYAVAHHVLGSEALVFGAQRVSVVDLQGEVSWSRSVSTPAGVPGMVAVSPELTLADGSTRHSLVVGSPAHITFVALDEPDSDEHAVQLTGLDRTPLAEPEQAVFDAEGGRLYVRARGAEDVFMFRFGAAPATPDLITLPAGGLPLDMALAGPDAAPRLAVLTNDGLELRSFALDGDTTPQRFTLA